MGKAIGALAAIVSIIVGLITIFGAIPKGGGGGTPRQKGWVKISYNRVGGPFLILGPNPGGVWATQDGGSRWWHMMEIRIANECDEAINVDPSRFELYLSLDGGLDNVIKFAPTSAGMQFQPNRLASAWVPPGGTHTGRLVYNVPERLANGRESNSVLHHVQFAGSPHNCSVSYHPQ